MAGSIAAFEFSKDLELYREEVLAVHRENWEGYIFLLWQQCGGEDKIGAESAQGAGGDGGAGVEGMGREGWGRRSRRNCLLGPSTFVAPFLASLVSCPRLMSPRTRLHFLSLSGHHTGRHVAPPARPVFLQEEEQPKSLP